MAKWQSVHPSYLIGLAQRHGLPTSAIAWQTFHYGGKVGTTQCWLIRIYVHESPHISSGIGRVSRWCIGANVKINGDTYRKRAITSGRHLVFLKDRSSRKILNVWHPQSLLLNENAELFLFEEPNCHHGTYRESAIFVPLLMKSVRDKFPRNKDLHSCCPADCLHRWMSCDLCWACRGHRIPSSDVFSASFQSSSSTHLPARVHESEYLSDTVHHYNRIRL